MTQHATGLRDDPAEAFLEAVRDNDRAEAARLLAAHPELLTFNVFTAAAAGNTAAVAEAIGRDPACAVATHGRDEWTPLAYACHSPLHRTSELRAADLRAVATRLLDAGASLAAASVFFDGERRLPIPALYHACMSDHVPLVRLLLAHGASTEDGESIYHAAQHNRRGCLETLAEFGADFSSRQAPYGNTPLYFLVGHHSDADGTADWFHGFVWLLEHGADPNVTSGRSAEAPLHGVAASQPKLATVRRLLAHGADVNLRRADGRTPYAIAVRHGNRAIAELLREHGAETGLQPIEEFLGACLAADRDRARASLAAHPDFPASITDEDRGALSDAVRQRRGEAIRLMVELGFRLVWQEPGGGTPLHTAAWLGEVDLVRLLLELSAPVNLRDGQFGSSPLAWTAHGSGCHAGRDAAYIVIADLLLDAGADRESSINQWGEAPEGMASDAVRRHLRTRGFAP